MINNTPWALPPANLVLEEDEVHIWQTSLDINPLFIPKLKKTLAADELNKAEQFYCQQDREKFIIARGVLREILSFYINKQPEHLDFYYGVHGKPYLNMDYGNRKLCFNISHSHKVALYAVTTNCNIGIDIEYIRTDIYYKQMINRFFSSQEKAIICEFPENMQHQGFFKCWTLKEAYVKATGQGLSMPLNQFDISPALTAPNIVLSIPGDKGLHSWYLNEINVNSDYVASLAVEGEYHQLKYWQWLP